MLRTHTCGQLRLEDDKEEVEMCGWCQTNRDHGGIIFVDLRDRYGMTQIVFDPKHDEKTHSQAEKLRREDVIRIKGRVRPRGKGLENPDLDTGKIEVLVDELEILNKAEVPPIEVDDRKEASEEVRMKYRYLDLRRPVMQERFLIRHKAAMAAREFLSGKDFLEIETPLLMKATPEGARDYIVPSRVNLGKFYALPQSPQLYKQILMVSGFDRYFQLARCLRDEDLRADRQPEFTQIDIEMSFVEQDDIFEIGEGLIKHVFKRSLKIDIPTPFKRITYKEAMDKYGCDKPDLRFGLELKDVSDIAKRSDFQVFRTVVEKGGIVKCINPKKDFSRKELDDYIAFCQKLGAKGMAWMKVKSGKLDSNIAKFFSDKLQSELISRLEAKEGSTIMFMAGKSKHVNDIIYRLRNRLGHDLALYDPKEFRFCWVVDFPLFDWDEEANAWTPAHHMFTMPKKEHLEFLEKDPGKVFASCYDLVLNGVELASGSIRIWNPEVQKRVMKVVGFPEEKAKERFGFLLEAFNYGAPPHGGFAIGFDRMVAMMNQITDIREVIAFPKNKNAACLMDGSPSEVEDHQLKELHIKLDFVKKKGSHKDASVLEKIKALLTKNQIDFDLMHHDAVYTSEEAAKVRKTKLRQGAKAMIFKADKKFIMAVIAADKKIDEKKLKKIAGASSLTLASPDDVKKETGLEIGSVPPFGKLLGLDLFMDTSIKKTQVIAFNAGTHTDSIKMKSSDYMKVQEPVVGEFAE